MVLRPDQRQVIWSFFMGIHHMATPINDKSDFLNYLRISSDVNDKNKQENISAKKARIERGRSYFKDATASLVEDAVAIDQDATQNATASLKNDPEAIKDIVVQESQQAQKELPNENESLDKAVSNNTPNTAEEVRLKAIAALQKFKEMK